MSAEIDLHSLMVPLSAQVAEPPKLLKKQIVHEPKRRGRKRLYASPALRQKAYRDRKKELANVAVSES